MLSPPKLEPSVEDKAFVAAFDKLMLDDVQNRREENPKVFHDISSVTRSECLSALSARSNVALQIKPKGDNAK